MALKEASVQFELGVESCGTLPSRMHSSHLNVSEIPWHFVGICWFEIPRPRKKHKSMSLVNHRLQPVFHPPGLERFEALRRLERLAEETELLVSRPAFDRLV